jgi:hypothetical protein
MVPKNLFIAVLCVTLLAWNGRSIAQDQYRPDQFLSLDLSKALLSPKPLGPPMQFVPGPIEVGAVPESESPQAGLEPKAAPHIAAAAPHIAAPDRRMAHRQVDKPRGAGRTRLARRHSNPLDAQAFDTRIQVWPCRSGGICNWQPQSR